MTNYKATTIYCQNEKGNMETMTVLQSKDEMILVGSIFKPDLKGIARTYVEVQTKYDDDRQEELAEMFENLQNKGFRKISATLKEKLEIEIDLDAERQMCREAIRKEWAPEAETEEATS